MQNFETRPIRNDEQAFLKWTSLDKIWALRKDKDLKNIEKQKYQDFRSQLKKRSIIQHD